MTLAEIAAELRQYADRYEAAPYRFVSTDSSTEPTRYGPRRRLTSYGPPRGLIFYDPDKVHRLRWLADLMKREARQ